MELRHLRYFVAVAEELNFTRAAKRLGINQPRLSLQIRQLEKEMGTALFYRRTRGVELTTAGKLLLEEAYVILKQVEQVKVGVRRRARGETGRINIGSAGGTYFHPLIPAIILEYRTHYPDVVMFPQASVTSLLVARLLAGQIAWPLFARRSATARISRSICSSTNPLSWPCRPGTHLVDRLRHPFVPSARILLSYFRVSSIPAITTRS